MNIVQARRQTRRIAPVQRVSSDYFPFGGGLNQLDSPLTTKSGQCSSCLNYEMGIDGGYRRIGGYEAFDGTASALNATYDLLPYGAAVDPNILIGSTVNGGTSGASAKILAVTEDGGFGVNEVLHNEDFGNAYWGPANVGLITAEAASLPWAGGLTSHLSKLTEEVNPLSEYALRPVSDTFTVAIGEYVYVSMFAKYTGSRDGILVQLFAGFGTWPNLIPYANFNLKRGRIDNTNDVIASGMELLADDVYHCWFISSAVIAADSTVFVRFFLEKEAGILVTLYEGDGSHIYANGLMVVIVPSDTVRPMGYIKTTSAAKNVRSGNLVLADISGGPFQDDEDLDILATVFGQAIGANETGAEPDSALDAAYLALAAANVTPGLAPTGSGAIRGVWQYRGNVYAFRDNAGATAADMWKAEGGGWTQIVLNDRLNFDAGDDAATPVEGETLTGAGGASAPIRRIVKTSGTWGVDAAGYFILGTVTSGPFVNNEQLQTNGANVALADGANAAQTLPAGGRYEFRNNNFYGASNTYRMYGVNGVGKAFEYDDTSGAEFFCEITTGMAVDTPNHLAVHNSLLFLSFPGGSVQNSGVGQPIDWTIFLGASEIGVGDEITGFNEEVGNSLFIFTRNKSFVLQGTSRANFQLDDFNVNAGAHEWSLQRIGLGTYFDDRGFTTVLQTQRVGSTNFQENAVSALIQPLVKDLADNQQVKCSHLIRTENIYRCYFDDGRVVSIGFDGHKVSGHMLVEYPFVANCASSEENATGAEETYIGADDGFVYRVQFGTSFNGDPVEAFIRTVLHHSGNPGQFKKYMQARLDAQLQGQLTLKGQFEYDFGDPNLNLADELDFSTDEAGASWDDFTWDAFVWDQPTSGIPQQKLEGEGVNIAAYLYSTSTSDNPHTLRGVSLQWQPRRIDRRN